MTLLKKRRRIQIIGKLSINVSVQFLGVPAQAWGHGFPFQNVQPTNKATGWEIFHTPNQNWRGSRFGPYRMANLNWSDSIDPCPEYFPQSPVNPRSACCRIRDDLLFCRSRERLRRPSNWRNPIVNPWVHCQDNNREGPVTQ